MDLMTYWFQEDKSCNIGNDYKNLNDITILLNRLMNGLRVMRVIKLAWNKGHCRIYSGMRRRYRQCADGAGGLQTQSLQIHAEKSQLMVEGRDGEQKNTSY